MEFGPLTVPTSDGWGFTHLRWIRHCGPLDKRITTSVLAALVRHGWVQPSIDVRISAIHSDDSVGSTALLSAIWDVNPDLINLTNVKSAIAGGTPEIVEHLWELLGVSESDRGPENDMLIEAVRYRDSGGVRMLEWLLSRGLDINYRTVTDSDEEVPWSGDPREHSERLYIFSQAPISRRLTALHAAAWKGNAEAVEYLLKKGATVDALDGLGQTARYIAERDGHKAVVDVIDAHVQGTS